MFATTIFGDNVNYYIRIVALFFPFLISTSCSGQLSITDEFAIRNVLRAAYFYRFSDAPILQLNSDQVGNVACSQRPDYRELLHHTDEVQNYFSAINSIDLALIKQYGVRTGFWPLACSPVSVYWSNDQVSIEILTDSENCYQDKVYISNFIANPNMENIILEWEKNYRKVHFKTRDEVEFFTKIATQDKNKINRCIKFAFKNNTKNSECKIGFFLCGTKIRQRRGNPDLVHHDS